MMSDCSLAIWKSGLISIIKKGGYYMKNSESLIALKFVSVMVLADLLGISRGLCYRLIREGQIPAVRLGRRLIIPISEVNELLDENRRGVILCPDESGRLPTATAPSIAAKTEDGRQPSG